MPHPLVYTMLRPVMRLLHARLDRRMQQLPLPTDAPRAHAAGADPDRILLFGSGPAVGYGVLSNELALPGHLARQLSAITGRGVDIDVVSDPEVTIQGSIELLAGIDLWRYDAVLLTVGVNNALLLTPVSVWRDAVAKVLAHVADNVPKHTRVLVVAVPPIRAINAMTRFYGWLAEHHAVMLNRETRRIVQGFPRFTYVPFSPLFSANDVGFRTTGTYQQWASIIVAPLSQQLGEPRDQAMRPADELSRRVSVNATRIREAPPAERLDRIATLAAQLLGTESAALLIADGGAGWVAAGRSTAAGSPVPAGSLGDATIARPGVLVVPDARADARYSAALRESGHPDIVFYAGYPIESDFGERIGVLGVYDSRTRAWDDADTELLRELALMAQRELDG